MTEIKNLSTVEGGTGGHHLGWSECAVWSNL